MFAAYADHTARYFNYSSATAVVWERANRFLDQAIDALLESGQTVADRIGPWEEPRPAAPPRGEVRLSMLTQAAFTLDRALRIFSRVMRWAVLSPRMQPL
ncbi:MAG: hypothetical protein H7Z41_16955 [Cytophagales bacterium]|nr:hypothetical protein [Armatimonadota bacterium]